MAGIISVQILQKLFCSRVLSKQISLNQPCQQNDEQVSEKCVHSVRVRNEKHLSSETISKCDEFLERDEEVWSIASCCTVVGVIGSIQRGQGFLSLHNLLWQSHITSWSPVIHPRVDVTSIMDSTYVQPSEEEYQSLASERFPWGTEYVFEEVHGFVVPDSFDPRHGSTTSTLPF